MLSLILKDVIIQKKSFVWALVYLIFFIFVFQSLGGTMYIAAVVAFVYLLVSGAFAYDDKYKSDIMLNSLPIKRENIVMAKYISMFVYTILGIITFTLISYIIPILNIPLKTYPVTLEVIVEAILGVCLMNSIFFPLMFKLGYTKAKVANIVLFFIFFFGLPILVNNAVSNSNINFPPFISNLFKNQSSETMFLGMIIFALVILFLSFMLSIKLYKKREF